MKTFLTFFFSVIILFQIGAEEIKGSKSFYDPKRHITFLDQTFQKCKTTMADFQANKKGAKTTLKILGSSLGQCRNFQGLLSQHIKAGSKTESGRILKLMMAQNILESYLICHMLGFEGDEDSKLFAKTLELRLLKVLPQFRPPTNKL